jgi:hypothetical protein
MNIMMNKEPERHEIEALLPWHAAGTLSRRDADRVEQALAADLELRRRYDLVREELNETIHLNETLGAPTARCMEKLFAAIDAEGERKPRRQGSFDFAGRLSEFLSGFAPRTLAWSAAAAALAIIVQAAVITSVVVKERGGTYEVASSQTKGEGGLAMIRFTPQATMNDITNFLGAHQATVVDGPDRGAYRIRFTTGGRSKDELRQAVRQMQDESKIVSFIAIVE